MLQFGIVVKLGTLIKETIEKPKLSLLRGPKLKGGGWVGCNLMCRRDSLSETQPPTTVGFIINLVP